MGGPGGGGLGITAAHQGLGSQVQQQLRGVSATSSRSGAASRMSPRRCSRRRSSSSWSNRLRSVSGARASPVTCAHSSRSHRVSQLPLKPVWPVGSTRRPRQKEGSGFRAFPGGLAAYPQLLEMHPIPQGVHRLPVAVVSLGLQLPLSRQALQGLGLLEGWLPRYPPG